MTWKGTLIVHYWYGQRNEESRIEHSQFFCAGQTYSLSAGGAHQRSCWVAPRWHEPTGKLAYLLHLPEQDRSLLVQFQVQTDADQFLVCFAQFTCDNTHANWMGELAQKQQQQQQQHLLVTQMHLPGTHNSASHSVFWHRPVPMSDGSPLFPLSSALHIMPTTKLFISEFVCCQQLTITQQLHLGARHLDLRLCHHEQTDQLFIVHAFTVALLLPVLQEIRRFLQGHPSECVIVEAKPAWNHRRTMVGKEHTLLQCIHDAALDDMLAARGHSLQLCALAAKCIFIYNVGDEVLSDERIWPGSMSVGHWADTNDVHALERHVRDHLAAQQMSRSQFNCVSFTLTPTSQDVKAALKNKLSLKPRRTLRAMAEESNALAKRMMPSFPLGYSVFCDFIDGPMVETIISRNFPPVDH